VVSVGGKIGAIRGDAGLVSTFGKSCAERGDARVFSDFGKSSAEREDARVFSVFGKSGAERVDARMVSNCGAGADVVLGGDASIEGTNTVADGSSALASGFCSWDAEGAVTCAFPATVELTAWAGMLRFTAAGALCGAR
jgi:hypothetical protein